MSSRQKYSDEGTPTSPKPVESRARSQAKQQKGRKTQNHEQVQGQKRTKVGKVLAARYRIVRQNLGQESRLSLVRRVASRHQQAGVAKRQVRGNPV